MKAALPVLAGALALAACSSPSKPPPPRASAPAARPVPLRPAPAPAAPVPVVPGSGWMDAALTPGAWEFATFPFGSQAIFRGPQGPDNGFALSCNSGSREIALMRLGQSDRSVTMRVLTETSSRAGVAEPVTNGFPGVVLRLDPRDPLLDAMALSKGRFAVEVDGMAPLYLPSWAEVSRVIEDCRE